MKKNTEVTEKILVKRHDTEIETAKQQSELVLPVLQVFIEAGEGIGAQITTENWQRACAIPEKFAKKEFEKEIPELPMVGRFTQKRDINTLEFPDLTEFIAAGNQLKKAIRESQVNQALLKIEAGKAMIDAEELEKFIDERSYYISHPDEIAIWNAYSEVMQKINSFNELIKLKCGVNNGIDINTFKFYAKKEGSGTLIPLFETYLELTRALKCLQL